MDKDEKRALAADVYAACHLTGTFTLRSGRTATEYFDKYQISGNPLLLARVVRAMAPLVPPGIEVLAGLELGAVPIAALLSSVTGLPACYVRKKAKPYGTARLAEGAAIAGKRTLIVEDVATSGGQIILSCEDMRKLGADVSQALVVIDREEGAREALKEKGIALIALFGRSDFA
jgi:orotate phosphoribosyltransferase